MSFRVMYVMCVALLVALPGIAATGQPTDIFNWSDYPSPVRIACAGDSITYGAGCSTPVNNYPRTLGRLLGARAKVMNFGIHGTYASRQGNAPYWKMMQYADAKASLPNIVILMLGTNDSAPINWKGKDAFYADYRAMVDSFVQLPSKPYVILCLPPSAFDSTVFNNDIVPSIKQVAAETHSQLVDFYTPMRSVPQDLPDGIHPNDAGYAILAQTLYSLLTNGSPAIMATDDDKVFDTSTVTITPTVKDSQIFYTLDGSAPSRTSKRYTAPLTITDTTTVRAIALLPNGQMSMSVSLTITKQPITQPEHPAKTLPGLTYKLVEANFDWGLANIDSIKTLTPVKTGVVPTFTLDPRTGDINFGFSFTGYITVPSDGIYTFTTCSDDGSTLAISDKMLVDNGGSHGPESISGKIHLKAGQYPITVAYFQGGVGLSLQVYYAGPGIEKQEIPASVLSHVE